MCPYVSPDLCFCNMLYQILHQQNESCTYSEWLLCFSNMYCNTPSRSLCWLSCCCPFWTKLTIRKLCIFKFMLVVIDGMKLCLHCFRFCQTWVRTCTKQYLIQSWQFESMLIPSLSTCHTVLKWRKWMMKSTVMEHFKNLCIVLRLGTMNTGTSVIP